jgi:glutamine synthetase
VFSHSIDFYSLSLQNSGDHIYRKFVELKRHEWDEFRMTITEWELKKYINVM